MYKHRLPPGFVLKAQRKEQEAAEKANEITLEEFLEHQRKRLPSTQLTPVTAETFAIWKKQRQDKKQAEEELARNKKATQAQANKMAGLSGKEMFTLNPELFGDDEEDDGDGEVSTTEEKGTLDQAILQFRSRQVQSDHIHVILHFQIPAFINAGPLCILYHLCRPHSSSSPST